MLLGEDLGWRHERGLETVRRRGEHRGGGHRGLAGADVSLQQPGHWLLLAHVFENLGQHRLLRAREPERQTTRPPLEQLFVGLDRDAVVGPAFALAQHQPKLQEEEIVESEPLLRRLERWLVIRVVNLGDGLP